MRSPLLALFALLCVVLAACADHRAGRSAPFTPDVGVVQFRTRTELPLDVARSVDIAVEDLDADGITDIAAVDLAGRLAIRGGLGDGRYETRESLPVSGTPLAIAAADLDGDGALDLTLVSADTNVATVFRNDSSGSFTRAQELDVEELPTGMVVGDYTGDALPDLVVSHLSRSDLLLFPGVGDGTFGTPQSIPIPRGTRTAGLTVADVNQDGEPDLLVCDTDNDRIIIRFGEGGAAGSGVAIVPVGATPVGISLGDLNSDGRIDIAVSAFDGRSVDLVTHRGDNVFAVRRSLAVDGQPARSVSADLDGDGFRELAVCLLNRSAVSIFQGGPNGLAPRGEQRPATGFPYRPLVADLVGDQRPDLGLVSSDVRSMNVYESTAEGLRSGRTAEPSTERPLMVSAADFDGDGEVDVATAGSESGIVSILTPDREPSTPVLREVWSMDVGATFSNIGQADVDGDGRPDLLLAVAGGVKILANESAPGAVVFRPVPPAANAVLIPGAVAAGLEFADVTGDDRGDLIATFYGDEKVVVLPGTDAPFAFADPVVLPLAGNPLGLAVGDFDVDGRPEVAVGLSAADLVRVFDVAADGRLERRFDLQVPAVPTYLATADFDGDGRDDLAVSGSGSGTLRLLISRVEGGFASRDVQLGASATALSSRDLDLDGAPDLLVTNLDGMSFDVVLTDGRGGVARRLTFPGVFGATSAVLADVTGDALPDLVIGSSEIDRLTVFRNESLRVTGQ